MRTNTRRLIPASLLTMGIVLAMAGTALGQGVGGGGAIDGGNTVTVMGTYTEAAPVVAGPSGGGGGGGGGGAPALPAAGGGGAPRQLSPSEQAVVDLQEAAAGAPCTSLSPMACVPDAEPAAPAAGPAPRVDWLAVARGIANDAAASIGIEAIDIGIVPEDVEGRVGLVGMPTWMWVENPSPETIGPMQRVVTSGPVVVSLNATMLAVNWDMGDGGHVLCPGALAPFTPYTDVAGDAPSPTCGYRYRRSSLTEPGKQFEVTGSSAWQVTWTATTPAGATGGVIPQARSSSTNIRIGENQVLVLPGKPGA